MDRQPTGKFLGICVLTAVVGGLAGGLAPARGPTLLPQRITFDQPQDTAVGQPVRLSAVTDADPHENLVVSFRSDTPELCTVAGATVTPVAPGFCVITATQGGDASYAPARDVAHALLAHSGRQLQTITFDQPQDAAVGQPVKLSASTDAHAKLVVSFRSDTPEACTVAGATVTTTTADVCTITASQGGDEHYAAARPARRSFQAHTGARQQTIRLFLPKETVLGQPVTLSASTDAHAKLVVLLRSVTPGICIVSGVTVATIAVGTCEITAFQGGSADYQAAQVSGSFDVTPNKGGSAQRIDFDPPPGTTVGVPVVLTAWSRIVVNKDPGSPTGLPVSYTSQNQRVCTVSGATVVPRTGGRCVITAAQDGNAQYLPATPVTQEFPVARASQTVTFTPPASATIGQPVTLTATASSWLPVTYTSSTPEVCTVSGTTLTPAAAGPCTVIASQPGDARYASADPVPGIFPVGKIPQTISFTPPHGAEAGQRVTLSASATSNLAVSFASATPGVCTVSGRTATTISAGACAIVASQVGNDRYAAAGLVRKSFPVARISQTIDFRQPPDVAFGRPVTLTATASSGLPVSYRTTTPGVCTVADGAVTTRATGACAITAGQAGDDRYAPARDATRSFQVERAPQAITFVPPDGATFGQPVTLSASASSGLDVSYHADTPAVCTVSGAIVSPATAGTCTITASQPGNDNYAPAQDMSRSFPVRRGNVVTVGKTQQVIAFAQPRAAAVGQSGTLAASATSGLVVSFRSGTPSVCTVSGDSVTAVAVGTCAVIASQAGDDRFAAARDEQRSFAVHAGHGSGNGNGDNKNNGNGNGRISQTIFFEQPRNAAADQTVPLSASATSGLALSFRSDTPAVCSVSGATVTTTTAGTCTVTASQAGDGRYLAARDQTESFLVRAGHQAQTITFVPPEQPKVGEAVTLTASATSGLLVAFQSATSRVCTVSGPTLTPIAAGTCTVTASQGGSDLYAPAREMAQSFDVAPAPSRFPGVLTILLAAVVFAAAGVASAVRKVRRARHHGNDQPEPQPTISAEPVPGPPTLVRVGNTGAGVRHTVRIESRPGASITRIKEGKS